MSLSPTSTLTTHNAHGNNTDPPPWWLAVAGLLALYLPVYWHAMHSHWEREEHAHGPMILAIAAWLTWQLRDKVSQLPPQPTRELSVGGWLLVVFGLATYLLGRVLNFSIMEFGSQPVLALGAVVLCSGWAAARTLWFPIFFLVFMIPLPDSVIDSMTGSLKQWVSVWAEHILALANYPVGRQGVMLTVGNYQLLVADACSGLHSMFTLTAMGLLVLHIKKRQSLWHQVLMVLSILPIAFLANIVRVMILVLITYHLGDEAGQGFMHGTAGIVVIVVAMLSFVGMDALLALWSERRRG